MTNAVATAAREAVARANELTGVPWAAITDARKDQFCCRDVSFVLLPVAKPDAGSVIICTPGLFGYSPNEGLSMWGAASILPVLFSIPGVAADLQRLRRTA
jgi:hypothetical protein